MFELIEELTSESNVRLAVMFSGGLDCSILAALASSICSCDEPIDLLNVAFEDPRRPLMPDDQGNMKVNWQVPDRITGRESYNELQYAFSLNR